MSCITKIKEASIAFTETEKKVADYILENPKEVSSKSVNYLAKKSNTSAAAWIRFSKRIGYSGITDLKIDLAKDSQSYDQLFNSIIEQNDTIEELIAKTQVNSTNILNQTYKLLNPISLEKAIQAILDAENIFLIGIGGSGIVCLDMMQKLIRLNKNVIYYEDPHVLMARLAHIKTDDVLLAISYSGETKIVNDAVDYAKRQKTQVIAITQYNTRSTLSKLSDIKLYTPIEEQDLRLGAISSRNSAFILSDLLYYGIAKDKLNLTKEYLIRTRNLLHKIN